MKPTIFVVEDQKDLRESICEELDRSGFNAVGVPHGEKALEELLFVITRFVKPPRSAPAPRER